MRCRAAHFRSVVAVYLLAFAASRSGGCEAPERRGIRGACRFGGHTQSARCKRNGTAGAGRRAGRGHASRQALPSRCVARGMLRSVLSLKARRCVERSRMATQRGDCPRGGGSARLAQARQRLLVGKGHSTEPSLRRSEPVLVHVRRRMQAAVRGRAAPLPDAGAGRMTHLACNPNLIRRRHLVRCR